MYQKQLRSTFSSEDLVLPPYKSFLSGVVLSDGPGSNRAAFHTHLVFKINCYTQKLFYFAASC